MRSIIIIIFIIVGFCGYSQKSPKAINDSKAKKEAFLKKAEAKQTPYGVGFGVSRSVIFLSRNIKEFNDAYGLNFNFIYGGNNLVRFAADYTRYNSLNIEPTWYNIKARTYEANAHFLARFKGNSALVYPLLGLSVNEFKGFFTGKEDFQNLRDRYVVNTYVKSYWVGLNMGLGYEHKLGPVKLTIAYKMRIGAQDVIERLNIMDVCYSFGLRYDIKALKLKYVFKSLFRTYKGRYTIN